MSLNGRRCIGICTGQVQEDLPSQLLHSIMKRATEYGYKVLIFCTFSDLYTLSRYDMGELRIFDKIRFDLIDGLVIMSETIKNDDVISNILEQSKQHDIFTVSVDRRIAGCYNIEFNYRNAFEAIVSHVIEKHNCKTINLVAGFKGNDFSEERIAVCRKVLKRHGLELDDKRIMYGDFWSEPTEKAMDDFIASGMEMPDAFVCCNDTMAMSVCGKLRDYGFLVPEDVIVTGFDGILEEKYHIPRLTTAVQDAELAGEKAVDAIVCHLEGRAKDNFAVIDHKIVWSHSCGCRAVDYREATGKLTPLFRMTASDKSYDAYMFSFSSKASVVSSMAELSNVIFEHSAPYCWQYFGINIDDDFMNMSDSYDGIIGLGGNKGKSSEKRLILFENACGVRYEPYFADGCKHFYQAAQELDVFLYWPIHFQEKFLGYGIMSLGAGWNLMFGQDIFRNIVKYSRQLNHVLEVANTQAAMKQAIAQLEDLYIRDHTGLYNRRGFYNEITKYVANARGNKDVRSYLVIISIDMDGLKTINDTYGHAEGDIALKAIASAMISIWGTTEICSRFGGDEFTIASICTENPAERGQELVRRIRRHLDVHNEGSGKPYKVCSSFGIHYEMITDDLEVDRLVKIADDLMYKEKAKHKESRYHLTVNNNQ